MANEVRVLVKADTKDAVHDLKQVDDAASGIGKGAKVAGMALAGMGVAAAGGLALSINAAANFEHAIDQVGAVSNATEKEMAGLSATALRIGKDTAFTATEAAGAMEMLAANGLSVADIMNGAADATIALAAAGGTDLRMAADVASTSMAVWGLKASDMTEVVNRLAGAANVSRFWVEDMAGAIAMGGGAAKLAGVEFGDFTTIIAATASSFNSGSDAGTSFKTFLQGLTPETNRAKAAFAELGLTAKDGSNRFFDAAGNLKSMAEVTQILHDATANLNEEQKSQALTTIFGMDAMRMAGAISQLTGEQIATMNQTMKDTSAADVAAVRMGNFKGSIEALKGSIEVIEIEIGSKLLPVLTEFASWAATEFPKAFDWVKQELGPIFTQGVGVATDAMAKLRGALAGMADNKVAIAGAIGAIAGAFALLAVSAGAAAVAQIAALAPAAAIILAVGGVVAALTAMGVNWKQVWEDSSRIAKETFAKFQVYYDSDVAPAVQNIKTAIIAVVTVLKDHWSQIEPFVRPIFIAIETAMMVLQNGIKLILDVISGDWEGAWNDIKALVAGIFDGIIALGEAFEDQMAAVFLAAKDAIMGIDWWQVGADIIKWAAQGLKDTAGSIISAAADIARAVGEKLNPKNWKGSPIGIQNWYPHYFSMGMANLAAEAETNPDIQRVREILTQRLGAAAVGKNLVNQYIGGGQFGLVPQFGVSQLDKFGSTFVTGGSQSFDPSLPNYVPSAIDTRTPSYIGGFAHGSDFVPKDGLAYLHKGEAVVPAAENRRGEQSITINLVVDGQVLARVVNLTNARAGV